MKKLKKKKKKIKLIQKNYSLIIQIKKKFYEKKIRK